MIKLSIVVPVYGVEPWIERCLRSIVEDPAFGASCELVVVDDGSPDQSMAIAERVCGTLANVRFLRQANQGLGAARNAGAQAACGAYLWFIDSDDWLTPGGLSRVVETLEANREVEVLNIDYVMSDGRRSEVKNHAQPGRTYTGVEYLALSCVQNPVQYYVFSLAFYKAQGLRFERGVYHEDALFTPQALFRASRVLRLAQDCYVYNLREGSIMSSGNHLRHARDMVRIVQGLEQFRRQQPMDRRGSGVLAIYSSLAIGGIYYYWKRLDARGRAQLAAELSLVELSRPVLRARRLKYLYAIAVMRLSGRWPAAAVA